MATVGKSGWTLTVVTPKSGPPPMALQLTIQSQEEMILSQETETQSILSVLVDRKCALLLPGLQG